MRRATEIRIFKILISDALSLIKVCVSALSGFITLERLPTRQFWMALITVPPYLKTISSLEWLGYKEKSYSPGYIQKDNTTLGTSPTGIQPQSTLHGHCSAYHSCPWFPCHTAIISCLAAFFRASSSAGGKCAILWSATGVSNSQKKVQQNDKNLTRISVSS